MERWQASGARKICLSIDDLTSMKILLGKAKSAGLITHLVKDAGHTEVSPGTVTVLGIGPAPRNSIDALTTELKPF
jgi:PTH2 family peptidyl-tRNA hydrolase